MCSEQQRDSIELQPVLCHGSNLGNLVGAELVIRTLILLLIFLVTLADSGDARKTFTGA